MRTHVAALGMVLALTTTLAPAAAATEPDSTAPQEAFLFTVEAAQGSTSKQKVSSEGESFTLRLDDLAPVTQFSDRPFREAMLISPRALVTHWPTWFDGDPPNAVLTWYRGAGKPPASIVVILTSAQLDGGDLVFRATRLPRVHDPVHGEQWQRLAVPRELRSVSLFIDDAVGKPAKPKT